MDEIIDLGQGALLIGELDIVDLSHLETILTDLEGTGKTGEIEIEITK